MTIFCEWSGCNGNGYGKSKSNGKSRFLRDDKQESNGNDNGAELWRELQRPLASWAAPTSRCVRQS
jgi:hypothetical protein